MWNESHSSEFDTPIDTIARALGVPFEPEWIKNIELSWDDLERLYFALKSYHQTHRVGIDSEIFRINIDFNQFNGSTIVQEAFDGFKPSGSIPRSLPRTNASPPYYLGLGLLRPVVRRIKRALPFCDEVMIEDPILAGCRLALCNREAIGWVTEFATPSVFVPPSLMIKDILMALAELRPLFDARLLRMTAYFPTPYEPYSRAKALPDRLEELGTFNLPFLESYPALRYRDIDAASHAARAMGHNIREPRTVADWADEVSRLYRSPNFSETLFKDLYEQAMSLKNPGGDAISASPFLDGWLDLDRFRLLVAQTPTAMAGKEVFSAIDLSEISTYWGINPDAVKASDLVDIRKSEDVFFEWRGVVRDAQLLARQYAMQGFSNKAAYDAAISDTGKRWEERVRRSKRGYLTTIADEANPICVGALGAALGGVLTGADPVAATVAALGASTAGILLKCLGQFERVKSQDAATAFFMATNRHS